ncbi:hypothetical protein EDD90_4434 [Streptomyces sp. Ag109_O5-1]|uniref:hypothetical protein n=1 Tax=Streptomyces sp. Ag109_O5-1 TaxID=1938851 RepID=UPI000F99569D|nr:hypothetical protein [Streptomyces sp. Ag109_O5-1]RPE41349.1 hypothetical protein EDD90_4434 [Streptomyces sp. Ag109_O5-1]
MSGWNDGDEPQDRRHPDLSKRPERPERMERPENPERPENRPGGYERLGTEREPSEESGRPAWPPTPTQPSVLPPLPAGFSSPPASPDEPRAYTPPPWSAAPTSPGQVLPPTPPPPGGYVPPRRRTGRTAAAVLALVLVAAATGLGVWYLGRGHGTGTAADPAPSVSVKSSSPESPESPESPQSPASPASETTPASSVPSGYRVAHDPVGYTLDVPRGWTRRQQQGEKAPVVYYDSPSDGRQLQIFELSEATPAESLDLAENDPGYGYSHQPGYRAGDRTSGDTWAELSYRYDDKGKGARQVVDHRFQAADGTLYAIRSSGPESLSAGLVRGPLTTAVDSFCPTDAQCS